MTTVEDVRRVYAEQDREREFTYRRRMWVVLGVALGLFWYSVYKLAEGLLS